MSETFVGRLPRTPGACVALAGVLAEHSVRSLVLLGSRSPTPLPCRETDLPALLASTPIGGTIRADAPPMTITIIHDSIAWETLDATLAQALASINR